MKAAIYLRISQDSTGEGLGVARQLEDCSALAQALDWEVLEVYQDNDVSATSSKPRPAYRRLLQAIQDGQIDAVVCWHADRLYRKMRDLEELLEIVRPRGTKIATVKAGTIDLSSDSGQMIAEILASVAGYEGRAKATRWKRSWRQGREAGKPAKTGSRLYGYTRDGTLIPEEADLAREWVDEVLSGGTLLGIANRLEQQGIRTTRDSVWRTGTLRQYLANPRIAGWSTLNGEIVAEGHWEPIVDRETWEGLRSLLEARTRPYVPRKSLLNGLIFCGACEYRMITGDSRGTRNYRCPKRPGMPGCGGISGKAAEIEELVESYAKERLADPRIRARIEALRAEPIPMQREIAELELRVGELERQLDEPGVPVATILRAIDRTKERQESLLADLAAKPMTPLPQHRSEWPTDLRRRRALVDLVVQRVTLGPSTTPGRFDPERVGILPR